MSDIYWYSFVGKRACAQQQEALNELLEVLGENARVYVHDVDDEGFVTCLSCEHADRLPESFGVTFEKVTSLELSDSNNLTDLSPILRMRNLHKLVLENCRGDAAIALPTGLGDSIQLKELLLHECTNFDYSSLTRANLAGLETVDVCDDHNEQVPLSIFSMSNDVRDLEIRFGRVKSIPNQIENLQHVDELLIAGDEIESIALGRLVCREKLILRCTSLAEFTVGADSLAELKFFDLGLCQHLEGLPVPLHQMQKLESLNLDSCYKLSIPEADILECSDSLVEFEGGFLSDNCTDATKRTHELLCYMVDVNNAGRDLLRLQQSIPSASWSHILGRCSVNMDCLFFFLTKKPDLIPDDVRQHQTTILERSRKRKAPSKAS